MTAGIGINKSTSYSIADSTAAGNSFRWFARTASLTRGSFLLDGEPTSSKGGHFYLVWREDGKLKRKAVGSSPREALNAWHVKKGILGEEIEPEPESEMTESKTIDVAIAEYLRDVKA